MRVCINLIRMEMDTIYKIMFYFLSSGKAAFLFPVYPSQSVLKELAVRSAHIREDPRKGKKHVL